MLKFLLLSISILTVFASQDTPIPSKPEGFSLGSNNPKLHIEAHYDLLCNDCKPSWGILEPILRNEFHITTNSTLRFTIHLYPFPCHVYSWITAQVARAIADNLKHPEHIFTYFNIVFDHQEEYFTYATTNKTQAEVRQAFMDLIKLNLPQYKDLFPACLDYGNTYDLETRTSFKYACSRGVGTTPTYFANGVALDGAFDWKAADWRKFLSKGVSRPEDSIDL